MTPQPTEREGLLPIGTMLAGGKYRIEQYLSSGGFGNTYVATDTAFDEKVAIKELFIKGVCGRVGNTNDISISLTENRRTFEAQKEKFRKEARRLRKLTNPHIVKVHNLFDENGTSYYVMDFIEGESLSARLKRTQRPMSETEVTLLLPQVLDALETVHREGVWHLDLKPGNIMVDKQGNVQLIDFGASKQLHNADGNSLSTSSALAYTPGYASSEQMEQNIEKFGPWTDLYSLGATLFHLLTLQQPPSPSDIDEDPDEALHLPDGIGRKTQELVMWLMKPNRKMRPQSVADVKQYLAEEENGKARPQQKEETPVADEEDTLIKKPSAQTATQTAAQAAKKPTPPTPRPGRTRWLGVAGLAVAVVIGGYFLFRSPTGTTSDTQTTDSIEAPAVAMKHVEDLDIQVTEGPENLRSYQYTGQIADSVGALPQGNGVAKFAQYGNIPAATYQGEFVDGICNDSTGKATLIFLSGDKYTGTFVNGYYDEGTYTMSDGSYFKGSFKNGTPWKGAWYNANGTLSANVAGGKEL